MLVVISLITFFFVITLSWLILSINNYIFFDNYNDYKQSNIINKKDIDLWKYYLKYYNQSSWDNLSCFSWNVKVDNNCYSRWYYGFLPPNTSINIWNFFLKEPTSFIFSWTQNTDIKIENNKQSITYNFNTTWNTKKFQLWYYDLYVYNKNPIWEQFFITTKTEWFKNIQDYSITYNCNCYNSWNDLLFTGTKSNCQNLSWCNNTWDYIKTWTIYSWQVLLQTNLNIYKNDNEEFKKLFYITWN